MQEAWTTNTNTEENTNNQEGTEQHFFTTNTKSSKK